MNVLKALSEDRFNKVLINVSSVNIINPYEIEVIADNIAHQVKNTNDFNILPFQCVLINLNSKLILNNVQNIAINAPQHPYFRGYVYQYNKYTCRISFYKELTVEQLNNLMVLFNAEASNFVIEFKNNF